MPGPPFAFGAVLVILALLVAIFIPESLDRGGPKSPKSPTRNRSSAVEQYVLKDYGMYRPVFGNTIWGTVHLHVTIFFLKAEWPTSVPAVRRHHRLTSHPTSRAVFFVNTVHYWISFFSFHKRVHEWSVVFFLSVCFCSFKRVGIWLRFGVFPCVRSKWKRAA